MGRGFDPAVQDGRGYPASGPIPVDTDGDGLSQYAEAYLKTRPTLVDSDGDGIPDGMEVRYGLDPLKAQSAGLDTDGDGVNDSDEFRFGSNPIKRDNASAAAEVDLHAVGEAVAVGPADDTQGGGDDRRNDRRGAS